jgi:hypothetical protein
MQVNLRGMGAIDPVTGLDTSATGIDLSSLTSGSPWMMIGAGALGLWVLSSLFSGTKKAYRKVARPIKKSRKRKAALEDAEERYRGERRRIERGGSSRRGGGFF